MLSKLNLEHILFLDIETVPEVQNFSDLPPEKQALWAQKSQYQRKDEFSAEDYYPCAGIWAEFGKIICISVWYFASGEDARAFRITTFSVEEFDILKQFKCGRDQRRHTRNQWKSLDNWDASAHA